MTENSETTDIIVVGGGGAGLTAAIFARRSGARVILLEKAPTLGGSTGLCVGTYTAAGTAYQKQAGIEDSPDLHLEDIGRVVGENDARDNKDLRRIMVDESAETLEWMVSLGMTFYGPVLELPNSRARMHNILPNAGALIYFLEQEAKRVGVDIRTNVGVEDLIVESGRVEGVSVDVGGASRRFLAQMAVILATGDFSASSDWKKRFNPAVANIDGMAPTSSGDGHRFGESLGVDVRFGEVVYGPNLRFKPPQRPSLLLRLPPLPFITKAMRFALNTIPMRVLRPFMLSFLTTYLSPEPTLFKEGAILVNLKGERFTDELDKPTYALAEQPEKSGFIVFDDYVAKTFRKWPNFISTAPSVGYAYFQDYKRTRPDLYHGAATAAALARSMKLPAEALEHAVAQAQAKGHLLKPPFHALGPVKSWIILSEGSLTVNTRHQVVTKDGSEVPGLYAVGAVGQGGMLCPGHGTHLAWAFTSGRRAGRFATELSSC